MGQSLNMPRICRHTLTAVYLNAPRDIINTFGVSKKNSKRPALYKEGVYVLGGIDENSIANSKIFLIDTSKKG